MYYNADIVESQERKKEKKIRYSFGICDNKKLYKNCSLD